MMASPTSQRHLVLCTILNASEISYYEIYSVPWHLTWAQQVYQKCRCDSIRGGSESGRHLGRQALVEGLKVAPESCAARHEHGLAVPAVQGVVPVGGKPPVRLIHPLPLLTYTAEDCRISYLMRRRYT